ncbi:MAG: GWxTD domain-containing protein [Balneolaceae bacterium]
MSKRLFSIFLFLIISISLNAQRVSYEELAFRSQIPTIFISDLILPGENGKTTLAFTFRFNNDFLPYKKIPLQNNLNVPADAEFYTTIRLNTEVFEGSSKKRNPASMKSASRDAWTDTLFVSNYEETQSDKIYASGSLTTNLEPGTYNYVLQLTMMQERKERNTQRRNIRLPDLSKKETGEVILVRNVEQSGNQQSLRLMNMEENVPFGEDFYALIRIPNYTADSPYQLVINEAKTSRRDTTDGKNIHTQDISHDDIFLESTVALQKGSNPSLLLSQNGQPYTYAVVKVPHKTFENAAYLLNVLKSEDDNPVAKLFFKSYWPDMPASLFNLNIAIDMLKYIVSDEELKRIRSGSTEEKEQKFREFWNSKDPTPETVYNELMAEFYRRVDYAYAEFGSQEDPLGHESDQGEVYIKYGPPNSVDRLFPSDNKVREVWEYDNRTFVFEASSGFGDFVLVGTR